MCGVWTHEWTQEAQGLKYKIKSTKQTQESKPNKVTKNTRAGYGCVLSISAPLDRTRPSSLVAESSMAII